MKNVFAFGFGFVAAIAAISTPIAINDSVAAYVSQRIYDCGVHVADGAVGGTVSGFMISGHRYGICVDGGSGVSIKNNTIE